MRLSFCSAGLLVLVAGAACSAPDQRLSGLYLAADSDSLQVFNILASDGGEVVGSATFIDVDKAGRRRVNDFALSGAAEGNQLALTLKGGPFNLAEVRLVGERRGRSIWIAAPAEGMTDSSILLTAASLEKVKKAELVVEETALVRAKRTTDERSRAETEVKLRRETASLKKLEAESSAFIERHKELGEALTATQTKYSELTDQMRRLAGKHDIENNQWERQELRYAQTEIDYQASNVDFEFSGFVSGHLAAAKALRAELERKDFGCLPSTSATSKPSAELVQEWQVACRQLIPVAREAMWAADDAHKLASTAERMVVTARSDRRTLMR